MVLDENMKYAGIDGRILRQILMLCKSQADRRPWSTYVTIATAKQISSVIVLSKDDIEPDIPMFRGKNKLASDMCLWLFQGHL
jgi:hypothetical protein